MNVVFGVDPGKSGAIAALYSDGNVAVTAMILAGKELDISKINEWMYNHTRGCSKTLAVIEKVHAMPGQGVSSMFSFGFNVGIMHGIICSLVIPMYVAAPQTWKKIILADTKKDKDAAIDYCMRAFPKVSLLATPRSKKPHSGIADALCIAQYGTIKYKDILAL